MSSDEETGGFLLDEDSEHVSQELPPLRNRSESSKRKRSSPTAQRTSEYDSMQDFVVDDEEENAVKKRRKPSRRKSRSYDSEQGGLSEEGESEEKSKKKKSKYKIHIPRDHHELPAPMVQYGTQLPADPDSSPSQIRGALWKLPRPNMQSVPVAAAAKSPPVVRRQASIQDHLARNSGPPQQASSKATTPSGSKPSSEPTPTSFRPPASQPKPAPSRQPPQPTLIPDIDIEQELADLPSDAFSSEPEDEPVLQNQPGPSSVVIDIDSYQPRQRVVAPLTGLRQTTLFGGRAPDQVPASQVNKVRNYRVDMQPEEPTHHNLDREALKHWIYPMNLGTIRDYQYSIVKNGLFNNTLVALPTGLGKTFIAATIMLNYFRWFPKAQIVFMAPTKPLCAQQIEACYNIAGIPRSTTTLLTGEVPPPVRAEEWEEKRVFFITPQTLDNDLRAGIADPKKMVLLVVDEAHRATGNYAYVKVIQFIRRFNKSFRVLALTATPGGSVEAVQEVIDALEISKVEIRTEESIDIQQFVHKRNIEQVVLEPSDEMNRIKELFSKTLQPLVDKLAGMSAYYNRDPMALTVYGLMQKQSEWFKSQAGRNANPAVKGMVKGLFGILSSIAHSIKLLNFHGIGPFYHTVKSFRDGVEEKGAKAGKYRKQINDSEHFRKMMDLLRVWINKDDFVGHPKMVYLCDAVLNHFLDAGDGRRSENAPPSSTRVIVFSEYRDSAEEIVRVLNRHKPMVRASAFVGQADSKRSEGMNQAKQQETINKFKKGEFNVLVATSIGEEGLDIGQVDLIICYDASGSPIRMLQRMGRTGRKRAGNIILLLMQGKEEKNFLEAQDGYEKMQKMICEGSRFNFRHDLSTRIIPREMVPEVDKKHIEIPKENELDSSMPEPRRRPKNGKRKKPAKKFNMPDGVQTGFRKASRLDKAEHAETDEEDEELPPSTPFELTAEQQMPVPDLDSVLLSEENLKILVKNYQNVHGDEEQEISYPELTLHPKCQRTLRPVKFVKHGRASKRFVGLVDTMCDVTDETIQNWRKTYVENGPVTSHEVGEEVEVERSPTPDRGISSALERSRDNEDHGDESDSDLHSSPPPRRTSKPQNSAPLRFTQNDSDSETNTSVISNSNDEFDSDLEDFVVPDDQDVLQSSSHHGKRRKAPRSSRSTSPPPIPDDNMRAKKRRIVSPVPKQKRFFEPTTFTATQESNADEMPELGDLLGQGKVTERKPLVEKRVNGTIVDSDSDVDMEDDVDVSTETVRTANIKGNGRAEQAQTQRGKRRRLIVEDSSDDGDY